MNKNNQTIGARGVEGENALHSLNANKFEPIILLENDIMEFK